LERWTATVSKSVSHWTDGKTICHYWLELAETSPPLAFKNAGDTGPEYRNRQADIQVTRDLIRGGQLLEIKVLDHVIVGNGNRQFLHEPGSFYS